MAKAMNNQFSTGLLNIRILFDVSQLFPYVKEEHRLRVFKNIVSGKVYGPKTGSKGGCKNCITISFAIYTPHQLPFG
jgi:hypothetical protein